MAGRLASRFRLTVPAGKATPQPPVGSALGQRGLNLMNFCKAFNDQTAQYIPGTPMQVVVRAYEDRTFDFEVRQPNSSYFIRKAAELEKGASNPGHEVVGRLSVKQIYEIAQVKSRDPHLQNRGMEGFCRGLVGSCKSMGIEVYADEPDGTRAAPASGSPPES